MVANSLDTTIMKALISKLQVFGENFKDEIQDVEDCLQYFNNDDASDSESEEEDEDGNNSEKEAQSGISFLGDRFVDKDLKELGKEAVEGYKLIMIVYNAMW